MDSTLLGRKGTRQRHLVSTPFHRQIAELCTPMATEPILFAAGRRVLDPGQCLESTQEKRRPLHPHECAESSGERRAHACWRRWPGQTQTVLPPTRASHRAPNWMFKADSKTTVKARHAAIPRALRYTIASSPITNGGRARASPHQHSDRRRGKR